MQNSLIIGRDREIAQLDLSIGPGDDGLRLAMLSGPSGLGKTTLSQNAAQRAADRGFRVAMINGRAGSLSTPFAPFIEAMPEFEVLLAVLAGDTTIDTDHAGIGIVNLLAELTSEQPILLWFDDAQALDESSIAILPYLVGVSERMNITLMFVEQTDATEVPPSYRSFIDGMLARRVVSHLQLGAMSDASIRALVAHVLELDDPSLAPEEVVMRAQGNPWFAKELAISSRNGDAEIPTNIAAAATARIYSLDEIGQELVFAIALCDDGAHISWLESLSEQRPRQFVRTIELINSSGLVREDGDILSIAHPLMQQALIDDLSSAMRRAIHLELADVIAEAPLPEVISARARGKHFRAAGRPAEAITEYLAAAEANEILGQLYEAYADLRHALDAEPTIDARLVLLRRCAVMAMQLGMSAALDYWTELGRLAAATNDNDLYAFALFQQYWASNDGTANERLQRAESLGRDRYGWSAHAAATLARMDGDLELALKHDHRAIEIAREVNDGMLEVLALEKLGSSLADMGRTAESIDTYREAIHCAISHRLHDWAAISWGCIIESLLDELQTAEAVSEAKAVEQYIIDLGVERLGPAILAWKASALMRAGDLDEASQAIERALLLDVSYRSDPKYRSDHFSTLVLLIRAELANDLGSSDAIEKSQDAQSMASRLGYASWMSEVMFEYARAIARRDGLDAALPLLKDMESHPEPTFIVSVALWLSRSAAIEANKAAATRARELIEGLGDAVMCPRAELTRDEVKVTLAVIDQQSSYVELEAISRRWADAGRTLDSLRALAITGALAMRSGDRENAKVYLQSAKTAFSTCNASYDADLVSALLRQLGTRSRAKSRTTNVGPLTKRELEIARLVASGLRNSEVASTLFLAEKTVAAHLSNIYGKVEVRSRVQLTAWIRDNDPEFESSLASA